MNGLEDAISVANKLIEKLRVKALASNEMSARERSLLRALRVAGRISCRDFKWHVVDDTRRFS